MPWRKPVASSTARGYGTATHGKERKARAVRHRPTDPCARCGHPLGPMGPWLHLDHNDNRTAYLGFSHGDIPCPVCGKRCNRSAGAIRGAQVWEANKRGTKAPLKVMRKINTASRW